MKKILALWYSLNPLYKAAAGGFALGAFLFWVLTLCL